MNAIVTSIYLPYTCMRIDWWNRMAISVARRKTRDAPPRPIPYHLNFNFRAVQERDFEVVIWTIYRINMGWSWKMIFAYLTCTHTYTYNESIAYYVSYSVNSSISKFLWSLASINHIYRCNNCCFHNRYPGSAEEITWVLFYIKT